MSDKIVCAYCGRDLTNRGYIWLNAEYTTEDKTLYFCSPNCADECDLVDMSYDEILDAVYDSGDYGEQDE